MQMDVSLLIDPRCNADDVDLFFGPLQNLT